MSSKCMFCVMDAFIRAEQLTKRGKFSHGKFLPQDWQGERLSFFIAGTWLLSLIGGEIKLLLCFPQVYRRLFFLRCTKLPHNDDPVYFSLKSLYVQLGRRKVEGVELFCFLTYMVTLIKAMRTIGPISFFFHWKSLGLTRAGKYWKWRLGNETENKPDLQQLEIQVPNTVNKEILISL